MITAILHGGGVITINQTVTLSNTTTISRTQFMASESSTFAGASSQKYSTVSTFTFSSARGVKTTPFDVKNEPGEPPPVSGPIEPIR
jgi:hypothetical protein